MGACCGRRVHHVPPVVPPDIYLEALFDEDIREGDHTGLCTSRGTLEDTLVEVFARQRRSGHIVVMGGPRGSRDLSPDPDRGARGYLVGDWAWDA
eukprot:5129155-Heterocapsa_arctica.AAC.1